MDCKGHTDVMMTFEKGAITSFSCKQKLYTKSLTEIELVRVDNALPQILSTKYFIEGQGYSIERNEKRTKI